MEAATLSTPNPFSFSAAGLCLLIGGGRENEEGAFGTSIPNPPRHAGTFDFPLLGLAKLAGKGKGLFFCQSIVVKFGVCAQLEEAPAILEAGFDYVEVGASGFRGLEEAWDPAPYEGVPILATNLFFDSRVKLFGPEATPYLPYVERTVERAASLGIPLMVVGSGASRRAFTGGGDEAFADVVGEIASIASGFGIVIAPESLNRSETNVGNDLRSLALLLRSRGASYTADSYHVLYEWDADGRVGDIDSVWVEQLPYAPAHVHVADLPRLGVSASDPLLAGFPRRLRELGFGGNVSLECTRGADFDLRGALGELRSLFGS